MPDEIELKLAAFSEAVCDVLASIAADNVVFRSLLNEKGVVLHSQFDVSLDEFRKTGKWQEYRDTISKRIRDKAKAKLDSMTGPVN